MGGNEAIPFKERAAAEVFVREHGGHVADYAAARRTNAEAPAPGTAEEGNT